MAIAITAASERRATIAICTVAVAVIAAIASSPLLLASADRYNDLRVYLLGGHAVLHGQSLYAARTSAGYPFTYPPFAAILLVPIAAIASISEPFAVAVWSIGTCLALVGIACLLARAAGVDRSRFVRVVAVGTAIAVVTMPIRNNLRFGQINVILLLIVAVDVLAPDRVPAKVRGVLTGIATAIKLTPAIFIAYLFLIGRRREALTAIGAVAASVAIGFAVLPRASLHYWSGDIGNVSRYGPVNDTGDQSIRADLVRAGMTGRGLDTIDTLLCAAVLAVIVLRLLRMRKLRGGVLTTRYESLAGFAIVGAGSLLISPISWTHHFVWLLPAVPALLVSTDRRRIIAAAFLTVLLCLSPDGLLGRIDLDTWLAAIVVIAMPARSPVAAPTPDEASIVAA